MTKTLIAWDLGATKCTAGVIEYHSATQLLHCKQQTSIKLTAAASLADLVHQIEANLGLAMTDADAICIGAAGHFDGEFLLLENAYPYPMHFGDIAKLQGWPAYAVIHDYAPLVCATFTSYMSDPANIKRLNSCDINPYGRRVTFGIGTGLGLKDGVLFENGDFWLGKNEMGHVGITTPPHADTHHLKRHHALMAFLQEKISQEHNPAISFEKILSGQGLVRLYQFLHPDIQDINPEQVGMLMRAGTETELMDIFAYYIGLFVGTVQLSFMPEGGIWISGGVALHHLSVFDRPDFNAGIYASPAYLLQREEYALGILCNPEHALIGGGYYASKRLCTNDQIQPLALDAKFNIR